MQEQMQGNDPQELLNSFFGGGKKNDDEGCIAGHAKGKPPTAMTYSEAKAECDRLDLDMCEESCKGTGCLYNDYPVYTKLECELATAPAA